MENLDENRIEQIVKTRKQAHSFYLKKSKVYQSFVELEQNTYVNGALSKKQKSSLRSGFRL